MNAGCNKFIVEINITSFFFFFCLQRRSSFGDFRPLTNGPMYWDAIRPLCSLMEQYQELLNYTSINSSTTSAVEIHVMNEIIENVLNDTCDWVSRVASKTSMHTRFSCKYIYI